MYPHAIFRISLAHHGFALHWIKLDEDVIEVVVHQFCNCHILSFPLFLFASVTIFPLTFPAILPPGISLKILRRNRKWLVRNGYYSMKTLWARAAKRGRQMQVSG